MKKIKRPKRTYIHKSKNEYLNKEFVCHICGRLEPIKRMMMYPNLIMKIVPKFKRPYDGACLYCFHYELPLNTQKIILEEKIQQNKSNYKNNCMEKRQGGRMACGLFIPQWVFRSQMFGNYIANGSMLYYRFLKQELKDVMLRIKIKGWEEEDGNK